MHFKMFERYNLIKLLRIQSWHKPFWVRFGPFGPFLFDSIAPWLRVNGVLRKRRVSIRILFNTSVYYHCGTNKIYNQSSWQQQQVEKLLMEQTFHWKLLQQPTKRSNVYRDPIFVFFSKWPCGKLLRVEMTQRRIDYAKTTTTLVAAVGKH